MGCCTLSTGDCSVVSEKALERQVWSGSYLSEVRQNQKKLSDSKSGIHLDSQLCDQVTGARCLMRFKCRRIREEFNCLTSLGCLEVSDMPLIQKRSSIDICRRKDLTDSPSLRIVKFSMRNTFAEKNLRGLCSPFKVSSREVYSTLAKFD